MDSVSKAVEAFNQFGSKAEAARQLGIPISTLKSRLDQAYRVSNTQAPPKQEKSNLGPYRPRRHLVIPDVQAKPGVDMSHLEHIGQYIADKRPDVIIQIGDFADLPSLSSYDVGKKSFEGRQYKADVEAAKEAMRFLCEPFKAIPGYSPRMVITLGNHEHRINRVVESDRKLEGTIDLDNLGYEGWGWEVIPFLEPIEIDGIEYVHYVTSGVMGRPAASAQVALRERMGSVVQGHVQHHDLAIHKKSQEFALFSGTCYTHHEDYLGAQGNSQKPGIWLLNEVEDGQADLMFVSLKFLRNKYGVS